eukprot:873209_1
MLRPVLDYFVSSDRQSIVFKYTMAAVAAYRTEFDELMQNIGILQGGNITKVWKLVQHISQQEVGAAIELNVFQKLELAERANEIYRQQLRDLQDDLTSLRVMEKDQKNIIENLYLRYDLGIITQDPNKKQNTPSNEIDLEELRLKAEAIAGKTILENFEIREMTDALRDENFRLRQEMYDLQDKINRQAVTIDKLHKAHKLRMDHVTKLLNAYGLDESFPIDRRDMHGHEGDCMLVYSYIRNEVETQYDMNILSDLKALITTFASRI